MAVFSMRVESVLIEIHDSDHGPPHCHLSNLPRNAIAEVNLLTLEVTSPRGFRLTPRVRRALKDEQVAMLAAWEKVRRIDR